jgi:hypothetical protein
MMNDLIRRKSQIDKINYTPIVRSQLLKIRDSTDSLVKALFSKMPYAAATLATPVKNLIVAKIDKGITAFPLPSQGSGSWWPFGSQSSQPPPSVSGPSPYRNDPIPAYTNNQPPPKSQPPPFPQQGGGWGDASGQNNGNNGGWGKQ